MRLTFKYPKPPTKWRRRWWCGEHREGPMVDHPIIFSGPMVRAILEGRKTQTRRVVRWPKNFEPDPLDRLSLRSDGKWVVCGAWYRAEVWEGGYGALRCPFGQPGDRLWIRETWAELTNLDDGSKYFEYRADLPEGCTDYPGEWPTDEARDCDEAPRWRPSIHMPKWACRLWLEVTEVRVERLQEISEKDAKAEGVIPLQMDQQSFLPRFEGAWDRLNAKRGYSWSSNPWVWVVEFKREDR